jgi:hypothetical protein
MLEDFVKPVQIGSLSVTLPALITAVCGLLLGLVCGLKIHIVLGLTIPLTFLVGAYNVNCTVVGHCNIWASFLTGMYVVYTIMFALVVMLKGKQVISLLKKK